MKRTDLSAPSCPVAKSLGRVGERWSILILRDTLSGLTRFDEFERSLGIAPNMLARRLGELVGAGMLERVQYSSRPPRYEYIPTELGWSFRSVVLALAEWGNAHLSPAGAAIQLVDRVSGQPARVGMVDLRTGRALTRQQYVMAPGPGADEAIHRRFAYIEARGASLEARRTSQDRPSAGPGQARKRR